MNYTNPPRIKFWSNGLFLMLVALTSTQVFAQVELVIEIDVSVQNEISINATDGLSAESVVGSNFMGFYFDNLFTSNGQVLGATLIGGDLTTSLNASNMSPLLFRGGAGGSDPGLNIWNFSTDDPVNFEAGVQAFAGSGQWMVDAATFALFTSANPLGDIYFPADTADDVAQAQLIGSYMIVDGKSQCDNDVGDVNGDGVIDLLDVAPFVAAITGGFVCEADINEDGVVDLLDVVPFVDLLTG